MSIWYTLFASTILPLIVKGQEEFGKNLGKDLYDLCKKYFTKDKQRIILNNLEQQPDSIQNQKALSNELTFLLSTNDSFSLEIEEILYTLSPKWALLIGKLETYRKLKHRIELRRMKWSDSLSESDESYSNDIQKLESKFDTIYKEIEVVCEHIKSGYQGKP